MPDLVFGENQTPVLYNDPDLVSLVVTSMQSMLGAVSREALERSSGEEDYWFSNLTSKTSWVLGVIRKRWSMRWPMIQTTLLLLYRIQVCSFSGRESFSSIKKSLIFFNPLIPRGWKYSPGFHFRMMRGKSRCCASRQATAGSLMISNCEAGRLSSFR